MPLGSADVSVSQAAHSPELSGDWYRWNRPTMPVLVIVSATLVFQFALLSLLRNEVTAIPSIVWTGLSAVLLVLCAFFSGAYRFLDVRTALATFGFLAGYPLLCVVSYWFTESGDVLRQSQLGYNALLMSLGLGYFLFGAALANFRVDMALWTAFLAVCGYVFWQRDLFMAVDAIYERLQERGLGVEYQNLGDGFVILTLLLAVRLRDWLSMLIFMLVALAVMFTIPSRSAALFGALALAFAPLVIEGLRARYWQLILFALAAYLGMRLLPLASIFEGTRFESIFLGTVDTSWQLRSQILELGLSTIAQSPLIGRWGYEIEAFGDTGYYVHNALDVWAQAGILAFALFCAIWFFIALRWGELFLQRHQTAYQSLPLLLFAALSWSLSRNPSYTLLFVCVGYFAALAARAGLGAIDTADDSVADPSHSRADRP